MMQTLFGLGALKPLKQQFNLIGMSILNKKCNVVVQAPPTPTGMLATAQIEASFLDNGIQYVRRIRDGEGVSGPDEILVQFFDSEKKLESPVIHIDEGVFKFFPMTIDVMKGVSGDTKNATYDIVAQAGALAESIGGLGIHTRRLRPWILAGSWLGGGLDQAYDAMYSLLRDHLAAEGSIRVVPMPDVPDLELNEFPELSGATIKQLRNEWPNLDLDGKAEALSWAMVPLLEKEFPSTARLEELGWHRIMAADWMSDMASQLQRFTMRWDTEMASLVATLGIDSLLQLGELPR